MEVLVRVRAAGICINDVRDFKGECDYSYPRIGGHEFAGEIYEIGSEVNKNRFHVGQRVVTYVVITVRSVTTQKDSKMCARIH